MPDYPQMPPLTQDEIEALLSQPLLAKICSLNEDGTIHIAPLLFGYADGEILLGTQEITLKVRNIKQNSNVTVLVDTPDRPAKGVIIYGKARLDYDNVIEKRVSIFSKYMPVEQAQGFAQALANKWQPVIVRVKPHRFVSYDYAKGSLV